MWVLWLLLIALILAIVYFVVLGIAYALAYIGLTVIIPLDFFGSAFTWIGVTTPIVGWLLYGCFIGAVVGFIVGLRKVGRTSDLWKVYLGATVMFAVLFFGSYMAYSSAGGLGQPPTQVITQSTPSTTSLPVIIGKWEGSFNGRAATLAVNTVSGNDFSGVMTIGPVRLAVNGNFNPRSQQIVINETRVLSKGGGWSLGVNTGSFSNNGRTMSGTGQDKVGMSYTWSFTKK